MNKVNQEINFWKARDLGDISNATFAFVKEHFRELFTVVLYTAGPFLLLQAVINVWFQSNLVMPTAEEQMENPLAVFSMFSDFRFYLAIIVGFIGSFVLYATMYSFVLMIRDGETPTPETVWARIREDAGIYVTSYLAIFAIYLLSVPLLFIPCLGWAAWFVGAIYLAMLLLIYLPARLHEALGAFEGISRAHELNKGHVVDSFLLLLVLVVLSIMLALVFMVPYMIVSFTLGMNSIIDPMEAKPVWAIIVENLFSILASLVSIVPVTAGVLQYGNLVERSESVGLESRIDSWEDGELGDNSGI